MMIDKLQMIRTAKFGMLLAGTVMLGACGTTPEERGVTGAGVGALGGALVGAPATGALVGGATGLFTDEDDLDLGEPIWDWD